MEGVSSTLDRFVQAFVCSSTPLFYFLNLFAQNPILRFSFSKSLIERFLDLSPLNQATTLPFF